MMRIKLPLMPVSMSVKTRNAEMVSYGNERNTVISALIFDHLPLFLRLTAIPLPAKKECVVMEPSILERNVTTRIKMTMMVVAVCAK